MTLLLRVLLGLDVVLVAYHLVHGDWCSATVMVAITAMTIIGLALARRTRGEEKP
jgi:hypothetical protein